MTSSALLPPSPAPAPPHPAKTSWAAWLMIAACAGVVLSLVWDFSWESTVGVDRVWAPPHLATALAVALAGLTAIGQIAKFSTGADGTKQGIKLGPWRGPLSAWICLWSVLAFGTALGFDRWWQSAYGLEAGIWHPPQWLKASSFFALVLAAATLAMRVDSGPSTRPAGLRGAMVGALALMLISVVTLPVIYANRQHSNLFYQIAAGAYPLVLTAVIAACPGRVPAARAALIYMLGLGAMVWVLPLFPARPLTGPVYQAHDHLMPPPFPLLLVAPALALDGLATRIRWTDWRASVAFGVLFFIVFLGAQWLFAEFLLSSLADNRFFAGGGQYWPFFLKIDELARTEFWQELAPELNFPGALLAAGLAVISAQAGLWLGGWLKDLQR